MPVKAKEPIRHNGTVYEVGEVIEKIAKKDENRLIKLGVAQKHEAPKKVEGMSNHGETP